MEHNEYRIVDFRIATIQDLHAISSIMQDAVDRMLSEGKKQWNRSYPTSDHIAADIKSGVGYVMTDSNNIAAYGAVLLSREPAYENIRGHWLSDNRYAVIHRLAVSQKAQGKGVATEFLRNVELYASEKGIGSIRADTNFDNLSMLHLFEKCGFIYCGEISYPNGQRLAFEKLIK